MLTEIAHQNICTRRQTRIYTGQWLTRAACMMIHLRIGIFIDDTSLRWIIFVSYLNFTKIFTKIYGLIGSSQDPATFTFWVAKRSTLFRPAWQIYPCPGNLQLFFLFCLPMAQLPNWPNWLKTRSEAVTKWTTWLRLGASNVHEIDLFLSYLFQLVRGTSLYR